MNEIQFQEAQKSLCSELKLLKDVKSLSQALEYDMHSILYTAQELFEASLRQLKHKIEENLHRLKALIICPLQNSITRQEDLSLRFRRSQSLVQKLNVVQQSQNSDILGSQFLKRHVPTTLESIVQSVSNLSKIQLSLHFHSEPETTSISLKNKPISLNFKHRARQFIQSLQSSEISHLVRPNDGTSQIQVYDLKTQTYEFIETGFQFPKLVAVFAHKQLTYGAGGRLNARKTDLFFSVNNRPHIDKLPSLLNPRAYHSLTGDDDYLAITGGAAALSVYSQDVELFYKSVQKWTTLPSMNIPRKQHASVIVNELLCVLGGYPETQIIEYFNIKTGIQTEWRMLKSNTNLGMNICAIKIAHSEQILISGSLTPKSNYLLDYEGQVSDIVHSTKQPNGCTGLVSYESKDSIVVLDQWNKVFCWRGSGWE